MVKMGSKPWIPQCFSSSEHALIFRLIGKSGEIIQEKDNLDRIFAKLEDPTHGFVQHSCSEPRIMHLWCFRVIPVFDTLVRTCSLTTPCTSKNTDIILPN